MVYHAVMQFGGQHLGDIRVSAVSLTISWLRCLATTWSSNSEMTWRRSRGYLLFLLYGCCWYVWLNQSVLVWIYVLPSGPSRCFLSFLLKNSFHVSMSLCLINPEFSLTFRKSICLINNFQVLILLDNCFIVMECINLGATRVSDIFLVNVLYMIFKECVYFSLMYDSCVIEVWGRVFLPFIFFLHWLISMVWSRGHASPFHKQSS